MRVVVICLAAALLLACTNYAEAKGGFSSGGGSGGFSSSSRSYGSGGRSYSSGGSYSSGRSYGSRSYSSPSYTSRTTTITRNYYGGGSGYYYHRYMMYPGFGMGYGYSNGLIEGLIGNLMHSAGTTVYTGGGYGSDALLYPNGMVVNQQGYQVGTYQNEQFQYVPDGQMVAQQATANPTQPPQAAPQQVIVEPAPPNDDWTAWDIIGGITIAVLVLLILCALLGD